MQFIAVVLLVTLHAWILANKIILKLLYSQNSFSELSDACKYYTVSTFNLPFNWYFYLHPQVDKGIRDVLQSDELFDCKPAIHRAFHFAKNKSQGESEHGPDYIEFREFRLFLQTLRMNFEYYGDAIYELFNAGIEGEETYLKSRKQAPDQQGEFAAVKVPGSWCKPV